ncbi:MAG: hypothetical protein EPN85_01095 [Bacteroidetes bacterium]|nr:MAG: hypothetical protein EPN85_01095 [Bacteroidota bacterium]
MLNKFHSIAISCLIVFSLLSTNINSQETDSAKTGNLFELSFGQSLLFFSESQLIDLHANQAIVIPTSSILFFVEFRPEKKIRLPLFFNVPTSSKQFVINNQLVNERASPTFGAGLEFKCFQVSINSKSKLEFEIVPLASFLLTTRNAVRFAPIIAGRIMLRRGEDFIMYIGSSYSFGTNTWGLLYGTGTVF